MICIYIYKKSNTAYIIEQNYKNFKNNSNTINCIEPKLIIILI